MLSCLQHILNISYLILTAFGVLTPGDSATFYKVSDNLTNINKLTTEYMNNIYVAKKDQNQGLICDHNSRFSWVLP